MSPADRGKHAGQIGPFCALVPMRHDSERVPGKNYRTFVDRPLFHHIVESLLVVDRVTRVLIDTDSPMITEQVAEHFPTVDVVTRPAELLGGEVPMTEILQHDAALVSEPWILQTHSTNPLLRPSTINAAIEDLARHADEYDSLFSVTRHQTRLYAADGQPLNHDPDVLLRTQDLPPVYEENSNLYLVPRQMLLEEGRRIGQHPLMFEVSALEAVDIDTESDFLLAEAIYRLGLETR